MVSNVRMIAVKKIAESIAEVASKALNHPCEASFTQHGGSTMRVYEKGFLTSHPFACVCTGENFDSSKFGYVIIFDSAEPGIELLESQVRESISKNKEISSLGLLIVRAPLVE